MEPSPFLFLIILVLISSSYCPQQATSRKQHTNITDLESLLAFRAGITDPTGSIDVNWTTHTSFCSWFGISCSLKNVQRVTGIRLFNMSLQGTISPYLGNLSFLSSLLLHNNSLTGTIPPTIGNLPRLSMLVLQYNSLSGPIPPTIFNMSSLVYLYPNQNSLSGSLPSNIVLPRIQEFSINNNHITGEIPSSFGQCMNLQVLSLSVNLFSGGIPATIGSLPLLNTLYLGTNQLTGTIPTSFGNLTSLVQFTVEANNLTGGIPGEFVGKLPNLQVLSMFGNGFTGSIPTALLNASVLNYVEFGSNKLTGTVPVGIGKALPQLNWFCMGDNQLTGGLEFIASLSNCRNLQYLCLFSNNFEGVIPDSIGNLSTSLQKIYAYDNHLQGEIPAGLGNLTGLDRLSIQNNQLTGIIPSTLARLQQVELLSLASNKLVGQIPSEFGFLRNLNNIYLAYNSLSGPIPATVANLSMLQYLDFSNNKLSSQIPQSLWNLQSLLQLDLSANNLNGSVPAQLGNMKTLGFLNLSMNQLSGNITDAIQDLQMLTSLDLSNNSFQGQIPVSFGRLINMVYLNLSHNFLTGNIPEALANLRYLGNLDLSFNKLQGQVPNGRVFSNLSIPILVGNDALCGAPRLGFPACSVNVVRHSSKRKLHLLIVIILATASSLVLLTGFFLIYASRRWRKVKAEAQTDITLVDYKVISRHDLVRATNNFSEANLLGKGGFGSVFKGCLDDGTIVAVKVLDFEVEGASEAFEAECQVLRMVRHRNLIKIVSVCFSFDFKALVLQFMPNGNLDKWLHSDNCYLNLLQRLNITYDVALALEYLHHHHPDIVLHCDLKPTNVLLDEEMVAHLSDFGIAKLLLGDNQSIASTAMPGTIGYIAPEYAFTGKVSRMGDVYSFGILLLETFTGKQPTDGMFDEESSLRERVCNNFPTTVLNVVDYNLLRDLSSNEETSQKVATIHHCVSNVIELGLLCSSYSQKERIQMTDVVVRLQKIKMEYLST